MRTIVQCLPRRRHTRLISLVSAMTKACQHSPARLANASAACFAPDPSLALCGTHQLTSDMASEMRSSTVASQGEPSSADNMGAQSQQSPLTRVASQCFLSLQSFFAQLCATRSYSSPRLRLTSNFAHDLSTITRLPSSSVSVAKASHDSPKTYLACSAGPSTLCSLHGRHSAFPRFPELRRSIACLSLIFHRTKHLSPGNS